MEIDSKVHLRRHHQSKEKGFQIIVDETLLKVCSELIWLWVASEPDNKRILALF